MKILVVFTGGTIGSVVKEGWISTDGETKHLLINKYREKTNDNETEFVDVSPYSVLSENLSAKELTALGKCIAENVSSEYDGVIVTHGTDTLQYTAAALSFMFQGIKLPVVLVSSDYPIDEEKANGVVNFEAAVEFIREKSGYGVFVSYKNEGENLVNIHSAARVIAHREADGDVFSLGKEVYAVFENGKVVLNNAYNNGDTGIGIGAVEFLDYPDILMVESRPADGYGYSLEGVDVIILAPYHSATINTENPKFKAFCEEANKRSIPIFLVNASDGTRYESAKLFDALKIEVLPMCSKISVFMKCWIALSMGKDIREFVKIPLAQEFLD